MKFWKKVFKGIIIYLLIVWGAFFVWFNIQKRRSWDVYQERIKLYQNNKK
jgi:hypothetical protein